MTTPTPSPAEPFDRERVLLQRIAQCAVTETELQLALMEAQQRIAELEAAQTKSG